MKNKKQNAKRNWEGARRGTEEVYRMLIENLQCGVFIIQDSKLQYINEAFARIAGYEAMEIIGRDFREFIVSEDLKLVEDRYFRRLKGEDVPEGYEFRVLHKNGTGIFVRMNVGLINYNGREASMGILENITEKKKSEEKLRENERFLANIFESIQDGIGIMDRDLNILMVNPTAKKWYPHAEIFAGKKCYEAFHNRSERCDGCPSWRTLQTGKPAYAIVSKSGARGEDIGWLEIYSFPLIDSATGEMSGAIEYVRDITERKRTEESLKLFSAAVENAPDGIQIVGLDGCILFSNSAVEKIYGFSPDEYKGKHVNEMNADPEFAGRVILPGIRETGRWTGELMVRHKNGGTFPILLTTSMVKDSSGEPLAMVGIIRDITERKRMEEVLLESEKRYRTLFESAGDAIFILDAEGERAGHIVAANKAAAEMHGYTINEMLTLNIKDLDTPETAQEAPDRIRRMLKGERIKAEITHRRKDGTVIPVEVNAGLLEIGDHKYILAFDRDITERRQAEEAIKRYAGELEESNRMKELFTDIMHHDLLNPLNIVSGYVEILAESEKDPQKSSYLGTIERNLHKGIELIESATRFSRLESLESIEFEDVDLREIICQVIEALNPLASRAGMMIENDTGSMPARANKIIEEVFANLISNAIKYASGGKKIIVNGCDGVDFWRIRIIDFGEGIKDPDKTMIFERFYRKEKKGVKGSGLGLAIARKIVELHRGRIRVEDNPEGGAIFVVELPKLSV